MPNYGDYLIWKCENGWRVVVTTRAYEHEQAKEYVFPTSEAMGEWFAKLDSQAA